jgi:hypothetical protein
MKRNLQPGKDENAKPLEAEFVSAEKSQSHSPSISRRLTPATFHLRIFA